MHASCNKVISSSKSANESSTDEKCESICEKLKEFHNQCLFLAATLVAAL